jgi:cytochrome oxidase Cu insertion factor (SCO1/SenC/PrrC family)
VATDVQQTRRNRLMLVGLFAMVLVPLLAAFLLYESSRSSAPWGTTNRGTLMKPIVSVADLGLTANGSAASLNASGNWWLVTVADGTCADDCQHALHQLRQLHVLLGRDASRVKRALVELGATLPEASLLQAYPELGGYVGPVRALPAGIYIIDPLGNVVLRYSYADAGKPVLEDLRQLLKVSHIG